jgi:hypothetical protein
MVPMPARSSGRVLTAMPCLIRRFLHDERHHPLAIVGTRACPSTQSA